MKLHPRVTRSMVELVKRFEGLRRRAARLPDGGWTIGYGHTRSAREGAVVSPDDAEALLYYDLTEVAEKVEAWTFTPLNQNQFESLTAFAFNIGVENFRRSTVLKRVNEGQHLMAAAALELWRKADFGGEDLVVDALVRRRAAEKAHYLTPPEGFRPSPTPVLKPTFDHSVIEAAANARAGRAALVVNAPLDGDDATATVERRPDERMEQAKAAPFVAVAAAGLATARLHQLFPEKTVEPPEPETTAPPFSLDHEPAEAEHAPLHAMNDGPLSAPVELEAMDILEPIRIAPVAAIEAQPVENGFSGFVPPPARQFDAPSPSVMAPAAAYAQNAPLFDAPSPRAFAGHEMVAPTPNADQIAEPTVETAQHDAAVTEIVNGHEPGPLHNRSLIYFSIGLLGVALFAAALFSMFSGKASPINLVVGLMGILLMTPAGGYFLLRFLNKRDGLLSA